MTDVALLIDSGADVTLLPSGPVRDLGIESEGAYRIEAFDGRTSFAPSVRVDLVFEGRVFRGRFLVIDQTWGVLGRNVLNNVSLIHDGPNLEWRKEP